MEKKKKNTAKLYDHKVYKFFRTFPREELIPVRRFIISPYYNMSQSVIDLFTYIRRYHESDYTSSRLANETVFAHLFPDEEYNHQKLTNLMSDLAILMEKYVAAKEVEENKMTKHKVLIDAYARRKNFDFLEKEIDKGMKKINRLKVRGTEFYKERIFLNSVVYEHPTSDQFKKDKGRLDILLNDLDEYYCLSKLKYAVALMNDKRILNIDFDINLLEEVKSFIASQPIGKQPRIKLYLAILEFQKLNDFDLLTFQIIKQQFEDNLDSLEKEEQVSIWTVLANCIVKKTKEIPFLRELFNLQKLGIEQKILIVHGLLSDIAFNNIIVVGLKLGEKVWLRSFINKYARYLDSKIRKDAKSLGEAFITYDEKDYLKTIEILEAVDKTTFFYDFRARVLRTRSYLESLIQGNLDAYEDLNNNANAAIKFFMREKQMSRKNKDKYITFFKLCKQLGITAKNRYVRLNQQKLEKEERRVDKLRKKIEQGKLLILQEWLKQQLEIVLTKKY